MIECKPLKSIITLNKNRWGHPMDAPTTRTIKKIEKISCLFYKE